MRFGKLALVLAAGLLTGAAAFAQPPGGGFGGGLAGMIGQSKELQDALKVDKDQAEKVAAALAKVREDVRDDLAKLRDRNTKEDERAAILKKVGEANDKALASVLKPEQIKRLHQIENQQAGVGLFAKEDAAKALKLSDEQQKTIKAIGEDMQADVRDLFAAGRDPETAKKVQAVRKVAMDSATKILSASQKDTLKDLVGEPVELAFGGFGPGGPGGGPGGPGGGPGGPGGFGAPSQPGQILSAGLRDRLKLTDEQKKQLDDLQKEVDAKLGKILTDDQKKELENARQRGPGGRPPGGADRP
jgi:hypothetical protein